jgi:hypothetical protein
VEIVWPVLLLVAVTFLGAQQLRGYIGEVRERAELDDDTRHAEQLSLMLAVESLVGRSVRYSVSFGRLQRSLSWKAQQLSDVLAYCVQDGLLTIEGEPRPWSYEGTRAFLTAEGARFAEWVRAGCPGHDAAASYTFNGPVSDANFAHGCTGDIRQATGGARIDVAECHRLVEAVRQELYPNVLPGPALERVVSILAEVESALAEPEPPHARLRSLAFGLRDVCLSAAGSGLWLAVGALVMHLT